MGAVAADNERQQQGSQLNVLLHTPPNSARGEGDASGHQGADQFQDQRENLEDNKLFPETLYFNSYIWCILIFHLYLGF